MILNGLGRLLENSFEIPLGSWNLDFLKLSSLENSNGLRIFQHTTGTCPKPPINSLCRKSLYFGGFRLPEILLQGSVGLNSTLSKKTMIEAKNGSSNWKKIRNIHFI